MKRWKSVLSGLFLALLAASPAWAHGGGGGMGRGGDSHCIVEKGHYTVHFAAYQQREHVEGMIGREFDPYCEDVPNTGKTTLVFDLLDRELREVPVAVRVVEAGVADGVEPRTVLYVPPTTYANGIVTTEANFDHPGRYTASVSVEEPAGGMALAHEHAEGVAAAHSHAEGATAHSDAEGVAPHSDAEGVAPHEHGSAAAAPAAHSHSPDENTMSFDLRVGLTQGISGVPLSPGAWAMIFGVAVAGYAAYYYYMRRRKA
jgi:hypothetical protein